MNAKQFLLCSIEITDKKIWSELITATGERDSAKLLKNDWELKKGNKVFYNESETPAFNYRDSLEHSRNFNVYFNKSLNLSSPIELSHNELGITSRDCSLIVDTHGNFLLIVAYNMEGRTEENILTTIKTLFKGRSITDNIGDVDWALKISVDVKNEVVKYVNTILGKDTLNSDKIELSTDAAFPLFVSEIKSDIHFSDLFSNEENIQQRTEACQLARDYKGSYFHVGWNYTLALGFPTEVNDQIFSLMTKMQMSYYKFRFYKEYFNETFTDLLQNPSCINTQKVEFFDRLQLNYHDFLTNYSKFKLGLFPKYHSEMTNVEKLWHINDDMILMEKTFTAQAEYVNKKYNDESQAANDKQNKALNFIALFQIIAFVSVVYDSVEFHKNWPLVALGAFTVISLFLIVVMKSYFSKPKNKGSSNRV